MKLDTLADLNKLLTLCRKQGVATIKLGDLELTLAPLPQKTAKKIKTTGYYAPITPGGITDDTPIVIDSGLSDEDLLFYSSEPPSASEQN